VQPELEYHRQRLDLEKQWKQAQLKLKQAQRGLRIWIFIGIALFSLLIGGVIAGSYINAYWWWLGGICIILVILYLIVFFVDETDSGRGFLIESWRSHQDIVDLKNQQRAFPNFRT
jgi:undecaprenyl pyrophosphate phosphatase UppP